MTNTLIISGVFLLWFVLVTLGLAMLEDQMKRLENISETIATIVVGFGIGFGITGVILLMQIGLIRW